MFGCSPHHMWTFLGTSGIQIVGPAGDDRVLEFMLAVSSMAYTVGTAYDLGAFTVMVVAMAQAAINAGTPLDIQRFWEGDRV